MGNKIFKGLKFPGMDDYYVLPEAVITKNEDGIIEIESYMPGESNIVIDKTLSASGAVAEAKAVGDALQNKVNVVEGSRLMTAEEANKLAKLVIDEDGNVGSTDIINVGNAEGILAIEHGGTGATDAATALVNLGVTEFFPVSIANGGTGSTTAVQALDNLQALSLAKIADDDTTHLIPEGADLNDYITPGAFRCQTSAIAASLSNAPGYTSAGFRLIVSATSTNSGTIQVAVFNSGVGRLWFRIRTADSTWGDWRHIMTDSNVLDVIYPVGSIYMSVKSTSPASLFGGTWTQLKDRFLLGAGSSYTAGNTSGSKSTTLKEANLPAHTHGLRSTTVSVGSSGGVKDITVLSTSSSSSESYITSTGSATSFTNMPPYLVVYMWKRTE